MIHNEYMTPRNTKHDLYSIPAEYSQCSLDRYTGDLGIN